MAVGGVGVKVMSSEVIPCCCPALVTYRALTESVVKRLDPEVNVSSHSKL